MRSVLPRSDRVSGRWSRRPRDGDFPDFLGIGAPKSGTTWLYEQLRDNPAIWLPPKKALYYFNRKRGARQGLRAKLFGKDLQDRLWREGLSGRVEDYRGEVAGWFRFRRRDGDAGRAGRPNVFGHVSLASVAWDLRYFFGRPSDRWYAALFKGGEGKVRGEISPGYSRIAPERVAEVHGLMPDAKIILLIRHPIERNWSNAVQRTSRRSYFAATPENLKAYFGAKGTAGKSDYLSALDVWSSHFPEEQIFVGFFEDIHFHPNGLLERIHAFLGVEPVPGGERVDERVNPGTQATIPLEMAGYLADLYRDELDQLAHRFGGYAAWWAFAADRLREDAEDDPGGAVTYPFYETPYWQEWLNAQGLANNGRAAVPPLQSNVLAALDRSASAAPRAVG
jgi:hypothetical protein